MRVPFWPSPLACIEVLKWFHPGRRSVLIGPCLHAVPFIPGRIPSIAQPPLPLQFIKQGAIFGTKSQSNFWLCDWDPAPISHVPVFIKTQQAFINLLLLISRNVTDVKNWLWGQIWPPRVSRSCLVDAMKNHPTLAQSRLPSGPTQLTGRRKKETGRSPKSNVCGPVKYSHNLGVKSLDDFLRISWVWCLITNCYFVVRNDKVNQDEYDWKCTSWH